MTPADLVLTPRGLRIFGRYLPCVIGKGGRCARKMEGDGATPTGIYRIVGMLYRADRLARPASWARAIGPRDIWSDDPTDPGYNHLTRMPHPFGHERLRRADPLYDLVLLTDWNWPDAIPGQGSAIFVHRWRRPGYATEGCIAMAPGHLMWLVRRLGPGARLVVR